MNLRYMTALARVKPSITCYAGYCAVHLLCKYTTTLGFLPPHTRKSCQPCCQPCSALLIFSLYARVKPNTCFACAWFPSSLTKIASGKILMLHLRGNYCLFYYTSYLVLYFVLVIIILIFTCFVKTFFSHCSQNAPVLFPWHNMCHANRRSDLPDPDEMNSSHPCMHHPR